MQSAARQAEKCLQASKEAVAQKQQEQAPCCTIMFVLPPSVFLLSVSWLSLLLLLVLHCGDRECF